MSSGLINAERVICLTEASNSHTETICKYIVGVERKLMKCFGDLYKDLIADKIDYSSDANYEGIHNDATTYAVDHIVYYKGLYYKAINENTEVEPGCTDDWEKLPVFEKECYNKIWEGASLERYIADGVYQDVLPFLHIDLTAIGLQTPDDKNFGSGSASKFFYGQYEGKLKERMQQSLDLVFDWMREQKEDGGCEFDLGIDGCGCDSIGITTNNPHVMGDRVSW